MHIIVSCVAFFCFCRRYTCGTFTFIYTAGAFSDFIFDMPCIKPPSLLLLYPLVALTLLHAFLGNIPLAQLVIV